MSQLPSSHVEGLFDKLTKSVWITNRDQALQLWHNGFFGKGDLSRSEPTWLARHSRNQTTSEEVTARRRARRKQFKLDRAKAIAAVAEEAEVIFATQGHVTLPALSGPAIPSSATWRPSEPLTTADDTAPESVIKEEEEEEDKEDALQDIEHLQLTTQEAFFLAWAVDRLTILDSSSRNPMSLQDIWLAFQRIYYLPDLPNNRFDNPFLIHYVAYHHYRSLGWVVKGGIKFSVDYLLYKRGPVFAHAEFAVIVCPVYEDPKDQASSPFTLQNAEPFTWSWLSTINRVNSQVQKTLVLAYVTIPAQSRAPARLLQSPVCLAHYSVREVVLRRFIPARMRDSRRPVIIQIFFQIWFELFATATALTGVNIPSYYQGLLTLTNVSRGNFLVKCILDNSKTLPNFNVRLVDHEVYKPRAHDKGARGKEAQRPLHLPWEVSTTIYHYPIEEIPINGWVKESLNLSLAKTDAQWTLSFPSLCAKMVNLRRRRGKKEKGSR